MLVKVFVLYLIISVAFIAQNGISGEREGDQLVFAQIIYRHGARSIDKPYPNDPWGDESNWPNGYGALTNEGKRQLFALGKFFRNRYLRSLLGNGDYSSEKVYVFSSDHPRTMMSAAVNLAGLFPPKGNQQWNKELLWQPIPIHAPLPWEKDYYLVTILAPCERFDYLRKPFFNKLAQDNIGLFEYLEKTLKISIDYDMISTIYNALNIESLNNMILPEWSEKVFYPGSDLEKLAYNAIKSITLTKEITRLKGGFLLRDIMDRFIAKANSTLVPDYRLWMYSAHDITIANILNIFGLYNSIPPFASALMLELNQSNDGYYVQMFYKNSTTENHLLDIPDCGTKCPLEVLYKLSEPYFPETDFETGCLLHDDEKDDEN